MKEIKLEQGTQAWLEWREQGIGASDVPAIFGISPYTKPWALYAQKTGKGKKIEHNPAMQKGVEYEPAMRAFVSKHMGRNFRATCGQHDKNDWMIASFDGFADDEVGIHLLECKYVGADALLDFATKGTIPEHHLCQMWYQAQVSGAKSVTYACTADGAMIDYTTLDSIQLDEIAAAMDWNLRRVHEFWKSIGHGQGVCSDQFWISAQELAELEAKIAKDLERIEELKAAMKTEKIGSFSCGYAITSRAGAETIDKKAMEKAGIDWKKYTKKAKDSIVLLKV